MASNQLFKPQGPELFFAIVAPVGADADVLLKALEQSLNAVNYRMHPVHLIELLHDFDAWRVLPEDDVYERYDTHMQAGNEFRERLGRADAFSLLGAARVLTLRGELGGAENEPLQRTAYVFRSLKRPQEVGTLRDLYGPNGLFVIAAHSPPEERLAFLEREISNTSYEVVEESAHVRATRLLERDEREAGAETYGQRVSDTFPLADLFVEVSDPAQTQEAVDRFMKLLFGYPFHTPKREEYAMFLAMGAASRSADLSRQVGAVITTEDGEVLGVGTNEVPKTGGGLYWEGDDPDQRDWRLNYVPSADMRQRALGQILSRLVDAGWLSEGKAELAKESPDRFKQLIQDGLTITAGTDLMEVTEYGRSVHAEMAALMHSARSGISVAGSFLYTTTFPCHVCARHIVAAGIKRVIYNEPYPKSLATFLHMDSLSVDRPGQWPRQVEFTPFVGVAPRRYLDLFQAVPRKTNEGKIARWDQQEAQPRLHTPHTTYYRNETRAVELLKRLLRKEGK